MTAVERDVISSIGLDGERNRGPYLCLCIQDVLCTVLRAGIKIPMVPLLESEQVPSYTYVSRKQGTQVASSTCSAERSRERARPLPRVLHSKMRTARQYSLLFFLKFVDLKWIYLDIANLSWNIRKTQNSSFFRRMLLILNWSFLLNSPNQYCQQ